jgi:hypothetical protein
LILTPPSVRLDGRSPYQSLLATGVYASGEERDLTAQTTFRSLNPKVVAVSPTGEVRAVGVGATSIVAQSGKVTTKVSVQVSGPLAQRTPAFATDILPVLSKAGCNQAACHAKQGGKNGFQLSVFAFDPEKDYEAVVRQADGRRINLQEPAKSLVLLKATMALPHAGGKRFSESSVEYRLLTRWIASGAPWGPKEEPAISRIEVEPKLRTLTNNSRQQLQVTAIYTDGAKRDVTKLAEYKSDEDAVAAPDEGGLLKTGKYSGEAAITVRYMAQVAVSRVMVPLNRSVPAAAYAMQPRYNFVDEPIYRKLRRLGLVPSPMADDATFLRRVYLDLIGTLPTAKETREFLAKCETEVKPNHGDTETRREPEGSKSKSKSETSLLQYSITPALKARAELVEQLLQRPEYADYWAMRWVNLLLVDRDPLFPKGAFAYDRWVRDAFRSNMPYDRFARELVTATGETYRDGPSNYFRALQTPVEQAKSLSQLFLGVRIDCAQCHHHPFERWGVDDFYAMSAVFARVKVKGAGEFEWVIYNGDSGEVKHRKTDAVMTPKPLGGPELKPAEGEDRRQLFAQWMTSPDNAFFAKAAVNRFWGMVMGRGIVEPIDDFRMTNPAVNDELLDALAADFVKSGYDLKHLPKTIVTSAAYQRSSEPTKNNARDTRNYARAAVKRLTAEVLLDAVSQATEVPEIYSGHPDGTRAIQMWDNKLPVEFLETFGRPSRLSVCECDRPSDSSVPQVLHLMNAPAVQDRLTSDKGIAARLDKSGRPEEELITELYLTFYSRYPTPKELATAKSAFGRPQTSRRSALEDLEWVLLNSPEFVFNH